MAKRLVISADDFGSSEDANRRIIKSYLEGTVTDLSLLAVGDSFEDAVSLAKKHNINLIGIHLALTGLFKPLTSIKFSKSYISFFVKYFSGFINKEKIYAEFKNQISKVKKEGFTIMHVDSHQHIHMAPAILKIVIRLMKEEDIAYVRFPKEDINIFKTLMNAPALIRHFMLSSMCTLSEKLLEESGVKHNNYFIGHAQALRLKKEDLVSAISNLKDGLTELECHPGHREEELEIFCDKSFADEIKKYSVELVSYNTDIKFCAYL